MPIYSAFTWHAQEGICHGPGYHKITWRAACQRGPVGLVEVCETRATDPGAVPGATAGAPLAQHLDAWRLYVGARCGYRYWQTRSYRKCP